MANRTTPQRGWELLQQAENAIYKEAAYPKAAALAALAEVYFNIGTDVATNDRDDGATVWVVYSGADNSLTVTYTLETTTGSTAPTGDDVVWNLGDGVGNGTASVVTRSLTSNVATLTTSAVHGFQVGQTITVSGIDSVFNGTYTVTAVTSTTFSYARTNANVASGAASGTARRTGLSVTHTYARSGNYEISVVVDTAALGAVPYARRFKVPYGL